MSTKNGQHVVLPESEESILLSAGQDSLVRNYLSDIDELLKTAGAALETITAKQSAIKNVLWRAANIKEEA